MKPSEALVTGGTGTLGLRVVESARKMRRPPESQSATSGAWRWRCGLSWAAWLVWSRGGSTLGHPLRRTRSTPASKGLPRMASSTTSPSVRAPPQRSQAELEASHQRTSESEVLASDNVFVS
jgi:hypothetical protein